MADEKGGSKLVVILLIISMLLVVGLASFFGYLYFFKKPGATNNSSPAQQQVKPGDIKTVALKEFVVNLSDEDTRFIKVTIVLGFTNKKLEAEINDANKTHMIRDIINAKIRTKKAADFQGEEGISKVKTELVNSINPILEKGKLTNIFLDDIIIQ